MVTNVSNEDTLEEVKTILENKDIVDKEEQNIIAQQKTQQTFIIVENDENVTDLKIENHDKEVINISRNEFPELIKQHVITKIKDLPQTDLLTDKATLIFKTIHFEGHAKWEFVFR